MPCCGMAETSYRVVPRGRNGFDVEMEKPNRPKKTVPGFRSEHEANAWIVQAKRLIRDAAPWTPLAPRRPAAKEASGASASTERTSTEQALIQSRNGSASRRAHDGSTHAGPVREHIGAKG
jgi:hypothetical protein